MVRSGLIILPTVILGKVEGIAEETGRMLDLARGIGQNPGFEDVAIAATAKVRGLTVLTRNARHFSPLGVSLLDLSGPLP